MPHEVDYLVIGAGAMGMAFTDTLLSETEATVALVDRHHQPGGHWNYAYPFVQLHQPSSFYGVNSRKLGDDLIDTHGLNKGLYELATSGEICAYFNNVMNRRFIPSGRVSYFPMCDYGGDGCFTSLMSGNKQTVTARTIVDASYMNVTVPSMREPDFARDPAITCVPPNGLARVSHESERYVVIGAGKTGIDCCLFLLAQGVEPANISWIMPRDSWLLDRANIQSLDLLQDSLVGSFGNIFEAIAGAVSVAEVFERIEAGGQLLRLDGNIEPTMYRCATVTKSEVEQLRRIDDVIRLGRVQRIESDKIVLDQGEVAIDPATLFVDCTADGLERRETRPVFDGRAITLQSVRTCQQVFSAAFIAHIEASVDDGQLKNELCTPVPHPDTALDFLRNTLADLHNGARWAEHPEIQQWLQTSRLDGFTQAGDPSAKAIANAERIAPLAEQAAAKLQQLLSAAG